MELAIIALYKIVVMFVITIVGIISYHKKLISAETNKKLSDILLLLISPLIIFTSYQKKFDTSLLEGLLLSLGFACISFAISIGISYFCIRKKGEENSIERISTIYSNCGFIGLPLVDSLFGHEGVFYVTAYITIFNILLWTQGVILMTGKSNWKSVGKAFRSPCVIAIILGILCFVCRITLPSLLLEPLSLVASMNTPLAMLVAGVSIAQSDLLRSITKKRIYYICFLKQLVIPILLIFTLKPFQVDDKIIMTCIIATACPVGSSGILFAIRYNRDALYASEIFAMSTILSAISIPVVILISEII